MTSTRQIGANVVGRTRLGALDGEPFDEVLDYGERRVLAVLADLGAGEWRAEDRIDSTGPRPDQQHPRGSVARSPRAARPSRSTSPGPIRSPPAT